MMSDPRFAVWIVLSLAALAGYAHGIRKVSDCDQVTGEQRIACGACTVKNEAQGWIGDYEYRPDTPPRTGACE